MYEWAVTHEGAYTADFGAALARVRERLASRRAVVGRPKAGQLSGLLQPLQTTGSSNLKAFATAVVAITE